MTEFQSQLLSWYQVQNRDLPWRKDPTIYGVLVSEFMLQQTTVATVIPFFERWMERFPDFEALAKADIEEVMSFWAGLGYYSRCRNLLAVARMIESQGVPESEKAWQDLPGIGPYTAAAVASIAQGIPVALVDGNVERVYSRISADSSVKPELAKKAWKWANGNLVQSEPGAWNQALMELGATICKPKSPLCDSCPVAGHCQARSQGRAEEFPQKTPKLAPKLLNHSIVIPTHGGLVGCRKTEEGKWWSGLWGFPRYENSSELTKEFPNCDLTKIGEFKHVVTNHRITVNVYVYEFQTRAPNLTWVTLDEFKKLAIPAPQKRALTLLLSVSNAAQSHR